MSYYDVDAILTDAEKIPCEFQIDVPGLGYLDQSPTHTLRAGTSLNLPLWLAEMLALANAGGSGADTARPFLTLNLPPALRHDVVQALKADPRAVALRDQAVHFYGLATRMLDLFDERDLAAVLRAAFVGRAAEVALHARKMGGAAVSMGGGSSSGGGSVAAGSYNKGNGGGGGGGGNHATGGSGGGGGSDPHDNSSTNNNSSNIGLGAAGQEFLRGLDEWERQLFRQAHDGAKAGREFLDNVKRKY